MANMFRFTIFLFVFSSTQLAWSSDEIKKNPDGSVEVPTGDGQKVTVPFDESNTPNASPEQLEQFLGEEAKNFKDRMREGLNELKSPLRFMKREVAKPAVVLIKEFPAHALPFYAGMGALTWAQAMINDGHDPMALENFVTHLNDLPSLIGFWAFMYGNNRTNALISFLHGKPLQHVGARWGAPIFYSQIGQAVGSILSGFTTEFLHDPNVQECTKNFFNMAKSKACSEAYTKWTSSEKWWDFCPGMVKVVAAGIAAGGTQAGVYVAGRFIVNKGITIALERGYIQTGAALLSGLSTAANFIPVPVIRFGKTFAFGAFNAIHFLAWDAYLAYPSQRFFMNWIEAPMYTSPTISALQTSISEIDKKTWSENSIKGSPELFLKLADYEKNIKRYRSQKIMYESEAEYSAWMGYLNQFLKMHSFSFEFYHDYIENILYAKEFPDKKDNPLFWDYSLKGVEPKAEPDPETITKIAENLKNEVDKTKVAYELHQAKQTATVKVATQILKERLEKYKKNSLLPVVALGPLLLGKKLSIEEIEKMIFDLESSDPQIMSRGIKKFQAIKEFLESYGSPTVNAIFLDAMYEVDKLWGFPMPSPFSEEGYLSMLGQFLTEKHQFPFDASFKALPGDSFIIPRANLIARTHAEWNLIAMVCGPEVAEGEAITSWIAKGTQLKFIPPKIVEGDTSEVCSQGWNALNQWYQYLFTENEFLGISPITTIGKTPNYISMLFSQTFKFKGKIYNNLAELIRDNVKPEILGTNKNQTNFASWWRKNIEESYNKTLMELQSKYEKIIRKSLLPQLVDTEYTGTVAKGLANSYADEAEIFLNIIKGIYKQNGTENDSNRLEQISKDFILKLRKFYSKLEYQTMSDINVDFHRSIISLYQIASTFPGEKNINLSLTSSVLIKQLVLELTKLKELDWQHYQDPRFDERIESSIKKLHDFNNLLTMNGEFTPPSHEIFIPLYESHLSLMVEIYGHLLSVDKDNSVIWEKKHIYAKARHDGHLALQVLPSLDVKIASQGKSKEIYQMALQRLNGILNEAYLNHQIIYTFYNPEPSLSAEKLKVELKKHKGGKLGL